MGFISAEPQRGTPLCLLLIPGLGARAMTPGSSWEAQLPPPNAESRPSLFLVSLLATSRTAPAYLCQSVALLGPGLRSQDVPQPTEDLLHAHPHPPTQLLDTDDIGQQKGPVLSFSWFLLVTEFSICQNFLEGEHFFLTKFDGAWDPNVYNQ